ncbi:MAG: DNA polymerase III subunit delta, partial [Christensenellales bacterium]
MKFFDVKKNIETAVSPVYIIYGTDDFLIKQTISTFKKQILTDFADLNFNSFNQETYNANNILNSLNGMPFGCDKKLVTAILPQNASKDDVKLFEKYFENPNPTSVFLLVVADKNILNTQKTELIDCEKLSQVELQKLIGSRLKNFDKTISVPAANLLIEKCDYDATRITTELEKLPFYNDEKIITTEVVENLVSDSFDLNIFNLTNALTKKNSDLTLQILKNMLDHKIEPSSIFAAIASNFRRMFISVISKDLTNEEIANALKVKPFAVSKAKENAKKFSVKNLKRINELLQDVEYKFKSGKMSAINS